MRQKRRVSHEPNIKVVNPLHAIQNRGYLPNPLDRHGLRGCGGNAGFQFDLWDNRSKIPRLLIWMAANSIIARRDLSRDLRSIRLSNSTISSWSQSVFSK